MSIYDFKAVSLNGEERSLSEFDGKVLLIVNTASHCGFTPQYKGLQALYDKYKSDRFEILGFPCNQFGKQEPGSEEDIAKFCELNYQVSFPMFAKIDVNGPEAHPLFQYLSNQAPGILGSKSIKWNFTKFLVDRNGQVIRRYAPNVEPGDLEQDIEPLL